MDSFAAIIDAFGTAKLAVALGLEESHVRTFRARDSIPPEYWGEVIAASPVHGIALTWEKLAALRANRFGAGSGTTA